MIVVLVDSTLLTTASTSTSRGAGWRTYANVRFALTVCYPSHLFRPGHPPENSDGLSFAARDGAMFTASGIKKDSIIYMKTFFADERFVDLRISYPRRLEAKYGPITAKMSRRLAYGHRPF